VAGLVGAALHSLQHVSFNLGATDASARLWTVEHVARAALLALLVPTAGIYGAPIATLLAVLLVALPVLRLARRSIGDWPSAGNSQLMARAAALGGVVALAAIASPWLVRGTWGQWIAGTVALAGVLAATLSFVLPGLRGEALALLRASRSERRSTQA
jgi:O-antigen/teichoic acid export membrane protein